MERYILDTSVFTNPDVYVQFAAQPQEALRAFLELAPRTDAEFYMPISVYREFRRMKDLDDLASAFEAVVNVRSPRRFGITVPSEILYEFIEEVRVRVNRGLRIAEEHMRMMGQALEEADTERVMGKLRDRYRDALRKGIVDSKEDADVLLLSYELDGVLVSADEGLHHWADRLGVKVIDPRHLRGILETLVTHGPSA